MYLHIRFQGIVSNWKHSHVTVYQPIIRQEKGPIKETTYTVVRIMQTALIRVYKNLRILQGKGRDKHQIRETFRFSIGTVSRR